ncbi:ZYRO0G00946p [Zygosaccharomyces rouxii]|uniref:ZYRO0G00946p n=2 Tax=Zygosaccharomyces rouxii TaxID=4956 RepID=C5E1S2_ZYGRC|nr:uncharacterized protein ZYRO0G00946g [Zygosaccharomyces rouxii]KAH9202113.1 WD40-repeat-containing domain protein [Zygosaccharomyces rouxii]CAR29115.1 ZYRO0G00946p [Zygosaccharomyces rouxii]
MPDTLPFINFINFNQTGTCISLGTSQGFKIFNCDPFGKFYSEESGSYAVVEMLFSTSLLAVVGIGDQPSMSPRRLRIINTKKHSIICEVTFPTSILSVKMNKSRLVVLLQEQIYIYDISNMRLLHTIDTNPNTRGIMAMSPSLENCYLVYPSPPKVINSEIKTNATTNNINVTSTSGSIPQLQHQHQHQFDSSTGPAEDGLDPSSGDIPIQEELQSDPQNKKSGSGNVIKNGDVILFNLKTLQPTMVIEAHKGEIASLALSLDGSLLATASEKGTIIRVFNVETGIKINQFRRGTYPTKIHSMCFSEDNQFLAATCSSKTIHIFKVAPANGRQSEVHLEKHDSDDSTIEEDVIDNASQTNSSVGGGGGGSGGNESIDEISSNADDQSSLERSREPYVDASRRTVARMIRKSSQRLSRHAAKTLGQIFPIKVSSLLEPSRHFASLKLPVESGHGIKSITAIGTPIEVDISEYPELFEYHQQPHTQEESNPAQQLNQQQQNLQNFENTSVQMLPIRVVTSEGYLYNYVLDPERGGDCLLLSQYSLMLA